jgi:hypothetical protein
VNIDAPKPTYNIWIGISHVFLPTFWCSKCDSWSSHHDKIHDVRITWKNMKDAQMAKQVEYRKQTQQSHYGLPQLQDRSYGRNDNSKRSKIAPTPTRAARAAQVITTEMVQHSTTIKRNTR